MVQCKPTLVLTVVVFDAVRKEFKDRLQILFLGLDRLRFGDLFGQLVGVFLFCRVRPGIIIAVICE